MKKVKTQEVINHLVSRVKDGSAYTAIGRDIGNIADSNGVEYTVKITLTRDEDEMDDSLELVDTILHEGLCIVNDPQDVFTEV